MNTFRWEWSWDDLVVGTFTQRLQSNFYNCAPHGGEKHIWNMNSQQRNINCKWEPNKKLKIWNLKIWRDSLAYSNDTVVESVNLEDKPVEIKQYEEWREENTGKRWINSDIRLATRKLQVPIPHRNINNYRNQSNIYSKWVCSQEKMTLKQDKIGNFVVFLFTCTPLNPLHGVVGGISLVPSSLPWEAELNSFATFCPAC